MNNVNPNAILIRYVGADWLRQHILQRGNGDYWTGDGWSKIRDCARVFRLHRNAQRACAALEVAVALVADNVHEISNEQLAEFIGAAVRIDVESSLFNDGPVQGSFVQLRLRLATLEETDSARKRF